MKLSHTFKVKPISANSLFGMRNKKKFKTKEYQQFQEEIYLHLMGVEWPFGKSLVQFTITAGLSNRGADLDNCAKGTLDTYQSIFSEFNDSRVYHLEMEKVIVPKGEEFLIVEVEEYEEEPDEE